MKKILSLLLVFVLLFTLTACSSTEDAKTEAASISVQVEESWLPHYEAAKEAVLANNPGSTIEFKTVASFDHLDVLDATDALNTDVADVFAIPADRLYGLAQSEVLASLDAKTMAAEVGGFGDYDAGLGGNFKIGDDYLAFPMNIETLIAFVNTANAEAKGVDVTSSIEMLDGEFDDVLIPVFNAWFGVAVSNAGGLELLGQDADGNLYTDLSKEYSELDAGQKAVIDGLFDYWQSHYDEGTDLWDIDAAWGYMDTEFTTGGNTVARIEGPWSTGNLSTQAGEGADLAIEEIGKITFNGLELSHWKGGWGLAVNSRIEEDEAKMNLAAAFIEELVNPENAVSFFESTGKILENASIEDYADLSETDMVVVKAVLASYADAPARPLFTQWGSVWDTWQNGIISWSSVVPTTPEEAYAELKASFEAMMSTF